MGEKLSKVGWLILICCVVLVGSLAYAEPGDFKPGSEPDGFRGIKWGQDISTIEGLVLVVTDLSHSGIDVYAREGDELKIGAAELDGIYYGFWQDKVCNVQIYINGDVNFERVKAVVFEKFGEGYQSNEYIEEYHWRGDETWMVLRYNEFSEEGMLLMVSSQISTLQQAREEEQTKEGAEEGW